jgi:glycosyltransferase involved in cell wall biosynthesis
MKKLLNILIFQTGEPLHLDGDNSRPMRAMNLSNFLLAKGHSVNLISTKFYHQKKMHREVSHSCVTDKFEVTLIDSPGYKKNISLARIYDHIILAFNLNNFLKSVEGKKPDVVFVGYPPIESAYILTRFCIKNGIPLVIDVKDQWPDYFLSALPKSLHSLGRLVLAPYYFLASFSFSRADLIVSMSESFLFWVKNMSKKEKFIDKEFLEAPLTREESNIEYDHLSMRSWWLDFGVNIETSRCVSFVGSISKAFEFGMIRALAQKALEDNLNITFVICGDGEESMAVKELMSGLSNVIFSGWVEDNQIAALMKSTIATFAPYKEQKNFSDNIPNKIIDSLCYGKPILTGLSGEVCKLINDNRIGLVWGDDPDIFYNKFKHLIGNKELLDTYALNAKNLYKSKFQYELVYSRLCKAMENLAAPGMERKA